ncbi:hypothetical protein [Actinomycetospora termitidis]|uniref:Uncharacterized protein n=1 Tax=Actinomycetospora termitidis TaxID=3053470 RepID=A0ABT7M5F4_9PSEU|nr:hypothetical protein [Actinomycetospora sp. Odt1-22]MDL5155681.1 hypothetical protein [Actinomycetospora sp. Odt1-22]
MRRGDWARDMAAIRDAADDDVIAVRRLETLGVPQRTSYRRCEEDGPWLPLLPGILKLTSGPPTRRQRQIAALLHAGDGAMITGQGGLRLHGMRRAEESDAVHVLVDWSRQVRSSGFAVIERTSRLPPSEQRDGLAVAPLVRCLTDAVRRLRHENAISALMTEPVQRRLLGVEEIREELDTGCRRGTAAPRAVLGAVGRGVRSPAEFDALGFWDSLGLVPAEWNVPLLDPDDLSVIAVPDAVVRDVGFAWEIDSVEEHFATVEQVLATKRRRQRLFDRNLYVVSTRPSERRNDPRGVRREIEKGLEIAARMPEPNVVYGEPRPVRAR